jgi:hypothetical protein
MPMFCEKNLRSIGDLDDAAKPKAFVSDRLTNRFRRQSNVGQRLYVGSVKRLPGVGDVKGAVFPRSKIKRHVYPTVTHSRRLRVAGVLDEFDQKSVTVVRCNVCRLSGKAFGHLVQIDAVFVDRPQKTLIFFEAKVSTNSRGDFEGSSQALAGYPSPSKAASLACSAIFRFLKNSCMLGARSKRRDT